MGKAIVNTYPNKIVKSSIGKRSKKYGNNSEKAQLKRKLPGETENVIPLKKAKIKDNTTADDDVKENEIESTDGEIIVRNGNLYYSETKQSDLFFDDELKATYFKNIIRDLYLNILEEISLEGLDGITTEALWKRLACIDSPLLLNDHLKEIMWKIICCNKSFQFYELPTPRGELKIFNRFEHFDSVGVYIETVPQEEEIYPVEIVNNQNEHGSCATYFSRVDISEKIRQKSWKEVEVEYGRKLVIVANQSMRCAALMEDADPLLELQNIEYCILERIGRSRKLGALSQGTLSLSSQFKMDPRSMFHYKKHMIKNGLVEKQFFYMRSQATEQNKFGRLLHLRKFYNNVKPKQLLFLEQIVSILKTQPSCRMPVTELKKHFLEHEPIVKICKSPGFRKFIKYENLFTYRSIYPNATKAEYLRKNGNGEKSLRCYELIDPHVNVAAAYKIDDESDSDEDDDEEGEEVGGIKIYNMELFREIYLLILSKGQQGCTSKELRKLVSVDRNSIRMALKKLLTKHAVHIRRVDCGKQRMLTYYAKYLDFEEESLIFNVIPLEKTSTVKEKLKERQRAAIERRKQRLIEDDTTTTLEVPSKIDKNKTTKEDKLRCEYFVNQNYSLPLSFEENHSDIYSLLTRKIFPLKLLYIRSENENFSFKTVPETFRGEFGIPSTISDFQFIFEKKDIDYITKLILLKASFNEIKIKFVDSVSRKRKVVSSNILPVTEKDGQSEKNKDKLQYMGRTPVTAYNITEDGIDITLIVSTPAENYRYDLIYQRPGDMSERVASRIQLILDIVNEKKIFKEPSKLVKVIVEKETQEGYQKKIDRKSLSRILKKLVEEGFIRIYQLNITDGKVKKSQTFICHPTITYTDNSFEEAIQLLKLQNALQKKPPVVPPPKPIPKIKEAATPSPFVEGDVLESMTQLNAISEDVLEQTQSSVKVGRNIAMKRGLKPKFIRMRIFHELLFFLLYDYSASGEPLTESEVKDLFKSNCIHLSEDDLKNMPEVYFKELSWKMFIPPLPHHIGWPQGWVLLCDIILRLPISVFCKVHNVSIKFPELDEFLNHPIKRFYLLKDIPRSVRSVLLFKRRYVFNIFDSLNRLAFCGLLQMGPQKYKEKEYAFIYLNLKASLLDTKTSEPGYNKISKQQYPKMNFYFTSMHDVDQYWYQMYFISLNTKLNQRPAGLIVTYTDVSAKPGLMETLKYRTADEAPQRDNGDLPGDNRGAAGIDSALWVHIAKNWFWASAKRNESRTTPISGLEREKMTKINKTPVSFKALHMKSKSNKQYLLNALRGGDGYKKSNVTISVPLRTSKTHQRLFKKIPKRTMPKKQVGPDLTDRMVLKKNAPKQRIKWTEREEQCLMMLKAGDLFFNPNKLPKQLIGYSVIRDILHRVCPISRNKTSNACGRRIKKNLQDKYRHLAEEVLNLFKIDEICDYFSPLVEKLATKSDDKDHKFKEKELTTAYIILMSYIFKNEKEVDAVMKGTTVDHLSSRNLPYTENNLIENTKTLKFKDPVNEDDIKKDVLKTVIHSTLTSRNQPDWALQLYKVYQKYPDDFIKSAVEELKITQTISCRKFDVKKNRISWHIPFKLSQSYIYFQFTMFNQTTALETYKTFLSLKDNTINGSLNFSKEVIESKKYGQFLGLNEFFTFWPSLKVNIDFPQYTVILNPDMNDHTDLVNTLALRLCLRLKKVIQENKAEEEQEEQEIDNSQPSTSKDMEEFVERRSPTVSDKTVDADPDADLTEYHQSNPLDLNADVGNTETIDQLKSWVTDCMERNRSPSPDFTKSLETITDDVRCVTQNETQVAQENEPEKQTITSRIYQQNYLPTLEEIKEEMLRPAVANEERLIPYITELGHLLNKESFAELNTDDETLEKLKTHFITQYPQLEGVFLEEKDKFNEHYLIDFIESHNRNERVWKKVNSEMVVDEIPETDDERILQIVMKEQGTHDDFLLTNKIVEYVFQKEVSGATSLELKERFLKLEKNVSLPTLLNVLTDSKILIRVGICTLTFVHYKYQLTWLIETFHLTSEEHAIIKTQENQEESFKQQLNEKKLIRIKVAPWTQINGTINYQTLNTWMTSVLSYCVEYPKISFMRLCEKFCYLKPVDVFMLLEALQELGCVDMVIYEHPKQTLFSSWVAPVQRNANFLDDFNMIFIETNNISMTLLGSFLYSGLDRLKLNYV